MCSKHRLVEVPFTATLANTANALLAGCMFAITMAAPPGHWFMIVDSILAISPYIDEAAVYDKYLQG
jgi:hypothetical protein